MIRTCVDRLAGDGGHTIAAKMADVVVKGLHQIDVKDSNGNRDRATLEIRYSKIRVLPPIGKHKRYPALDLTVIHAAERDLPKSREKIEWKLITDLSVAPRRDAIEKIEWHAKRWKIEVFHKILKSGCRAEQARLRTAQRLTNLIAVFCIVAWRIFWMTMLHRFNPDVSPDLALADIERAALDHLASDTDPSRPKTLSYYLTKIVRLSGYFAPATDPPPGNMVMWRGMSRLTDIRLGMAMAAKFVGIGEAYRRFTLVRICGASMYASRYICI